MRSYLSVNFKPFFPVSYTHLWFDSIGLTAREREIGLLLAYGRTQPWIAERLSISENTVGTHVRCV